MRRIFAGFVFNQIFHKNKLYERIRFVLSQCKRSVASVASFGVSQNDFLSYEVLEFFGLRLRDMVHRTKRVYFDPNSRYLN